MKKHIVFDCDGTLVDTTQVKYTLYTGIKELLVALAPHCQLYVWTARDRRSTLRILEELGVIHFFTEISTIDDALPKPHVSGLMDMLLDTEKSLITMIGDTTTDVIGAKNFGIKSIGAAWNVNANQKALSEAGADYMAQTPEACLVWIHRL